MTSPTIGILCTHMEGHYQSKILHACMKRARELGYGTLIMSSGPLQQDKRQTTDSNFILEMARDWLDGLVLLGGSLGAMLGSQPIQSLVKRLRGVPMVNISSRMPGVPSILSDNYLGVFQLVEHLVTVHDCRRIAFFPMREQHEEGLERLRGYREGLLAQGIAPDDNLVIPLDAYPDVGRGMAILMDERGLQPRRDFDALILADEFLQMEIGPVLQERGIRIPEDLALAGFDYVESQESAYSFFSMAQALDLIGKTTIDCLHQRILGLPVPDFTLIPPRLLNGTSCGCPDHRIWVPPKNPMEGGNDRFERSRLELLAHEAFKVLPDPLISIVQELQEQLFLELVAGSGGDQSLFLRQVAQRLAQAEANTASDTETDLYLMEEMMGGLSRFRTLVDDTALPREIRLRCNGLITGAIQMIADARYIRHERLMRVHRRVDWRIRATVQRIHSVSTRKELMAHFVQHCLWLEIPNASLCLFTDRSGGPIRVYAACLNNQPVMVPDDGWLVPDGKILPDQLMQGIQQHDTLVLPLYFNELALGYLVMEVNPIYMQDMFVFQTLRLVISGALNSTNLILETEKARRAAEQANRAKGSFLARMSHELRTPLNGILGFAELLQRDGGLTPEQGESVGIISSSGEHLLSLINDLLDFSRIEAQRFELYTRPIELRAFVKELVQIVIGKAVGKGLDFHFDLAGTVPHQVVLDDRRLRQVLLNLLSNACKFTKTGTIDLLVECGARLPDSRIPIHFRVTDTGCGMDELARGRLFIPFEQLGAAESRQEGSGLGLVISQQLVHQMGGQIEVASQPGQGSSFWFDIDVPCLESGEGGDQLQPQSSRFNPAHHWLLIADDSEPSRNRMVAMLEPLGFSLTQAASGEEVIESLAIAIPDIILMDQFMPGMSTLETVRRIRQLPGGAAPVIILLSTGSSEKELAACIEAGCDGLLAKPFSEQELFTILAASRQPDPGGMEPVIAASTPPVPELSEVLALARSGKLPRIREYCLKHWNIKPELHEFCRELDDLLNEFDGPGIIVLVQTAISQHGVGQ